MIITTTSSPSSSSTLLKLTSLLSSPILLLLFLQHYPTLTNSHGFLSTPRSRNLVAYEDRLYHDASPSDPYPEDCPTCINRGGTLARCGVLNPGTGGTGERNYDFPKNVFGDAMPPNPQNIYEESSIIDVEVVLSAHHKGHFVFKACPILFTTVSPTQECFDEHPLLFVEDKLYGAPVDVNHPERAYVAPIHHPSKVKSNKPAFDKAMVFQFSMQLPPGVVGELVLIQWYYVASNSGCSHEGYAEYPWPDDWLLNMDEDDEISDWESKLSVGTGLDSCENLLPPDGQGVPEQFWNCAEVSIVPQGTLETPNTQTQIQSEKTIIGYFASWQWYDRNKFAEPWLFDYRKYTRVNFAFFQTNEQGDLWGTDSWADPNLLFGPYNWNGKEGIDTEYCSWDTPGGKVCQFHFYEKSLMYLAKKAGAEVWPSIGGWSLSDPFPVMAANVTARTRFAEKCIELIEDYGFDGIDIDWEYPGYEAHSGTPDDTKTYNLLLKIVREKLDELGERTGKFYGLTAALPCGSNHISNINIPIAAKYLTELNLMTYDFFGAWSPTTGANAPLYDQNWGGEDVARYSVDGCVKNWVEGGGSPSAINIGLPFYGRSYLKAKHLNEPHPGKPDKNVWSQDEGSPQYFNIVKKLKDLVSVRHELTATQYAYNDAIVNGFIDVGGMVSYDDEEAICDKTEYCLEHELNGFIIWEMTGDLMDDGTTPLIDAVHAKLKDPTLDCKSFAYDPDTFSDYATPFGNEVIATFARAEPPSPAASPTASPTAKPTIFQYETECPAGVTNFKSGPGCTSYYRCSHGKVVVPITPCQPGTLFDESLSLCNFADLVQCTTTPQPTRQVTSEPTHYPATYKPTQPLISQQRNPLVSNKATGRPITNEPTRYPITNEPTRSIVLEVQNEPQPLPETQIPTRQPSRHPVTNRPSPKPTEKVVFASPTPPYEVMQAQLDITVVGVSKPTKRPTKRQMTPRPTHKKNSGGNTLGSNFINLAPASSSITIVEYRPSKGEENLGNKIKNQIQQQLKKKAKKELKKGKGVNTKNKRIKQQKMKRKRQKMKKVKQNRKKKNKNKLQRGE